MTKFQRISLFFLRISLGCLFFYAGITKVINPEWTAAGYLKSAKFLPGLFNWFAGPQNINWINCINEWGLTLLGVSLILGIGVRLSSVLGVLLMLLYYLPLGFPYPNAHSFIVDEHVIYIFSLLILASFKAGRVIGLENWCSNLPFCSKYSNYRSWIG